MLLLQSAVCRSAEANSPGPFVLACQSVRYVIWRRFRKLINAFGMVVEDIKAFAMPILSSLTVGEKLTQQAGNGWIPSA